MALTASSSPSQELRHPSTERMLRHSSNTDDSDTESISFLYDTDTPPTWIERLFGEPYHVKDNYASHRVSLRFVFTLMAVYVAEGCLDWLMIAVRYYGTSTWNIGPTEMQNFRSVLHLPWTIKIVYGLTIDCVPLFGYKRKSYMLFFGILATASMFISILWAPHYQVQLVCLTLNQLSVAFCDVIADALTVERTEFKSHSVATRLQSLAWASRYTASIVGILVSTRIELSNKPHDMLLVYWLYLFITLSIPICSLLLPEKRICNTHFDQMLNEQDTDNTDSMILTQARSYSAKQILFLTFQTICRKSILYPLLFVFTLGVTPSSKEALDYYLMYNLKFSSVYIGYLRVATGVAFLISIGMITYQARSSNHKFSLRKVAFVWTLIATVLPFMTLMLVFGWNKKLGIPDIYFMASDKVFVAVALDMLHMAINVLFARICPPGIEGVFMTVLTSISNIASVLSLQISSAVTKMLDIKCIEDPEDTDSVTCNFTYLWLLIVIANLSTLAPLIFIKQVPDETELKRIGEELKDATGAQDNERVDRPRMCKIYWIIMDHVVPFVKNKMWKKQKYRNPSAHPQNAQVELMEYGKDTE
eukprot:173693_1